LREKYPALAYSWDVFLQKDGNGEGRERPYTSGMTALILEVYHRASPKRERRVMAERSLLRDPEEEISLERATSGRSGEDFKGMGRFDTF